MAAAGCSSSRANLDTAVDALGELSARESNVLISIEDIVTPVVSGQEMNCGSLGVYARNTRRLPHTIMLHSSQRHRARH